MRLLFVAMAVAATLSIANSARAESPLIGVAVPLDERMAVLGSQLRNGASMAANETGARLLVRDDSCTAEGGQAVAQDFVEAGADIVVGFLCTEAIEAALPILRSAGIVTITPGIRTDAITDRRERTANLVWRLGPRADGEAAALGSTLTRLWRGTLFAIVDDGTIYGRDLAESFRLSAELAGLQPVFVDNFRPQSENQIGLVGRLLRAGATHAFVGGDREDIAIMARDAASLDYPLTLAGGEALRAPGELPLAAGTLMVSPPEWSELANAATLERYAEEEIVPEGYTLLAHAAVEVAVLALEDAQAQETSAPDILSRPRSFQTVLGDIAFDEKGDLTENPFRLFRYDGTRFEGLE